MLDARTVEVDDAYIGARGGGAGRGTSQQALIVAVDRAPAGKGSCIVRVAEDCSGDSYRQFGHDHLCHASRIRTDSWSGSKAKAHEIWYNAKFTDEQIGEIIDAATKETERIFMGGEK